MNIIAMRGSSTNSIWPLFVAPFICLLYFQSIRLAFIHCLRTDFDTANAISFPDISGLNWGPHWIYRLFADVISTGVATFVSSGIARGRERYGGIIGSVGISVFFATTTGLYLYSIMRPEYLFAPEPWYEYFFDALIIFSAPCIGFFVSEYTTIINDENANGFGGISRFHYAWMWIISYSYAIGLIPPITRWYVVISVLNWNPISELIQSFVLLAISIIPTLIILIPGYFGLMLLSGKSGSQIKPALRNLFGILVLNLGIFAGLLIQAGWYSVVEALFGL